jgi:hypothetical protein
MCAIKEVEWRFSEAVNNPDRHWRYRQVSSIE